MDELLKLMVFLCLVFWNRVFGAALPSLPQTDNGSHREHIVIIDQNNSAPPQVHALLQHVDLYPGHPSVVHIYNNTVFRGFAAFLQPQHVDSLSSRPDVSIVEPVSTLHLTTLSGRQSTTGDQSRPNSPWGLQRISTSSPVTGTETALDFTYSYYDPSLGQGSDIYIIDTGIYTENAVFAGRATMLWSFDGNMQDLDGHGTHVSGTAGGNVVGVASNANIFGLKALGSDGTGSSSNVVAAIDQAISSHDSRKTSQPGFRGSVISMSLSTGGTLASLNHAVNAAIAHGIHTCVAAGNDNADACEYSPSQTGGNQGTTITVGAVNMDATRAGFSNYGSCVDLYAPGVDVISAWIGAPEMVNLLDGTSMATPHVAGIIAYFMANATLAASPALMKEWVRMTALSMSDGILLANNGVQADDPTSDAENLEVRQSAAHWPIIKRAAPKLSDALERLMKGVFTHVHVFPRRL